MIDIETRLEGNPIYMTFVYGNPVVRYRDQVWERLSRMGTTRSGAWFMIGDFNEITGNSFSWVGKRRSGKVKCKLDRAVANEEWHALFSHSVVEFLQLWGSDHRPVLARIQTRIRKSTKNFRFDKRWIGRPGFKDAVTSGWGSFEEIPTRNFHQKITSCRKKICHWKKQNPTNSAILIKELKAKIDLAQDEDSTTSEELEALQRQLSMAFKEENTYWEQKSRNQWHKHGDRNTKFHHSTTKQRRAQNRVISIKDKNGKLVESEIEVENVAVQYFRDLFSTSLPTQIDTSLRFISEKVSSDDNRFLLEEPSEKEIKKALFDINPDKAPGPDGMTSKLFQKFWREMRQDIIRLVRDFFATGSFDPLINQTNICLIPKKKKPRDMTEFRPISLCNVSYKIISKLLCKRLKRVTPNLISETQSAFVAKRLITDNILIAQENFHALRTNQRCREDFMAIKTDMSKAYDRVEWSFLASLMIKMGFDERLVDLIMCCVTSVSYQVLINGQPKGRILPRRGLRQGDPLSPFLFIMCTEALISLLNGAEAENKLTGLRVSHASPRISHLLFADDSLFFCKAETSQCKEIIDNLEIYGNASGQRLNVAKSSMFFGNRVEPSRKQEIKNVLGFSTEGGMGMYLGLPEHIGGSKMKVFSFVQDRFNGRCYLLPQGITDKLKSTTSNFWWSSNQNSRGLHWIAWDEICTPKDSGGLGFRDFHDFNLALLAKQLWRLIHYPNSLIARVLKGRYYRHTSPLDEHQTYSPSYGWRSIMAARPLLTLGLRRTIGTGGDTRAWTDPWVPDIVARAPRPADHIVYRLPQLPVHAFIRNDTKEWNAQLLKEFFHQDDIPLILGLKLSHSDTPDGYIWNHTKSGVYSVKTGYDLLSSEKLNLTRGGATEPSLTGFQSHVWKIKAPNKIKHFLWQAISGCVATAERLTYRHLGTDRSCPRCAGPVESINHLLFECPPALQVWALSDYPSLPGYFPSTSIYQNLNFLFWKRKEVAPSRPQVDTFPWICWYIWKARNDKVFNGKDVSPVDTLRYAIVEADCWKKANEEKDEDDDYADPISPDTETVPPWIPRIPVCQIDASWINNGRVSGLGWCFKDGMDREHFGLRACHRSLSALHAEMEGLLWAATCLRDMRMRSVRFETDCRDLVEMMANPTDWPAFATNIEEFQRLQGDFEDVSISHIPRSRNERADALAKSARSRGYLFSHIDQTQTDGDTPRRIGSSALQLI
ncbi:uncharacterized protein LOC130512731 [Raphanus sativus]|uniref:Uncharacterized protein LOC130512731 n=1 Tax=Raphanus sativus TaxID=3726 RepID=A0A9W3DSY4_RAPSA|nr:uncharacterized protein LOC130512731 [Raphanus sativus]